MLPLTKSLAALEVAVGFLVSVGGDPNTTLGDFMLKTLQMKTALHSDRVREGTLTWSACVHTYS